MFNNITILNDCYKDDRIFYSMIFSNENYNFYSMLIVPRIRKLKDSLSDLGFDFLLNASEKELCSHIECRRIYCDIIHSGNKKNVEFKKVLRFSLIPVNEGFFLNKSENQISDTLQSQFGNLISSFFKECPEGIG